MFIYSIIYYYYNTLLIKEVLFNKINPGVTNDHQVDPIPTGQTYCTSGHRIDVKENATFDVDMV